MPQHECRPPFPTGLCTRRKGTVPSASEGGCLLSQKPPERPRRCQLLAKILRRVKGL